MRAVSLLPLFAAVLTAQDFSHIAVDRVGGNLHYAEGPVWSYDGFLLVSDSVTDRIHKLSNTGDVVFAERAGGAMGNAFDAEGRLYTCEFRERRVTRTLKNGKIEVLAARFEGKRFNAPDDIVVRRDGHVYFTDPAFGAQQDQREMDYYGVFHVTPKGEIDVVAKWRTRPNGVTLSPNGRTLYVSDSDARLVRAYDLDGRGAASKERVVIEKIPGVPGGIRTDEKGNLYVAAKDVMVYALPNDGAAKLLGEIPLRETPSNLAFGDQDMATLYITARTGVYRVRLGVKGALPY